MNTGIAWLSKGALEDPAAFALLTVSIPDHVVSPWEWTAWDDGRPTFLMPAEIVDRYGPPQLVSPKVSPEKRGGPAQSGP